MLNSLFTIVALFESMRAADGTNWALSRDQILDLASSLSDFFCHNNVSIKREVEEVVFGGHSRSELHLSDHQPSTGNYASSQSSLSGEDSITDCFASPILMK